MEKRNFKARKILIITLSCAVLVLSIIVIYLLSNRAKNIENEPTTSETDSIENETVTEDKLEQKDNGESKNNDNDIKENIKDETKEEYYSVIFLDNDGQTLQSSYFKKGTAPYYSGKELTKSGCSFKAWIPSITVVNGNQAYIATYSYESSPSDSSIQNERQSSSNTSYASIMYEDMTETQQTLFLQSGTTINFSAGEHGLYDSIPASITLTNNQQLDITDSSYEPTSVEANYIFKGFSYSGNTMKCEYALAENVINIESRQTKNIIRKNDVLYMKLDYLEGTGTQYIDTGIKREATSEYDFEFQFNTLTRTTYTNVWGCDERERTAQAYDKLYLYTTNNNIKLNFGDRSNYSKVSTTFATGTKYRVEIKNNSYILNGTEYTGIQWTDANNSDCIFWSRIQNPVNQDCLNGRFYYYKTWKGSELKLNLIPAKRLSDNVLGMFDLVTGNFLTNAGSGTFNCPEGIYVPGKNAGRVMASGSYEAGSSIELTAVPNDGYTFVGWSDGVIDETRTVQIGGDAIYTAFFAPNE